jgi:hypothetical protein
LLDDPNLKKEILQEPSQNVTVVQPGQPEQRESVAKENLDPIVEVTASKELDNEPLKEVTLLENAQIEVQQEAPDAAIVQEAPTIPLSTQINLNIHNVDIDWTNEIVQDLLKETNQIFVSMDFLGLAPELLETQSVLIHKGQGSLVDFVQGSYY